MFRVNRLPDLNLEIIAMTRLARLKDGFDTDLSCHVSEELLVVHHPTAVVINVSEEVLHLVICREHSCRVHSYYFLLRQDCQLVAKVL